MALKSLRFIELKNQKRTNLIWFHLDDIDINILYESYSSKTEHLYDH